MSEKLTQRIASSMLYGGNAPYIEAFYEQFLQNPDQVPEHWRTYFRGLESSSTQTDVAHGPIRESFFHLAKNKQTASAAVPTTKPKNSELEEKQSKVLQLINAHRVRGHQAAKIDPLNLRATDTAPDLDPAFHGISAGDMNTEFNTGSLQGVPDRLPLKDILALIRGVYTESIGTQYMHLTDTAEKRWIQARLEGQFGKDFLNNDQRKKLLKQLTAAEGIEKYLHNKYVGQKRFSLEGGDSMIPAVNMVIEHAANYGVEETIIGMAHRGRLNVLVNVMGKSPAELFQEFEGAYDPKKHAASSGDVKYHMGFSTDIDINGHHMHLVLAFNPSHLEIVNPVVGGSVRARQDARLDRKGHSILPLLIHGDAAFAGQGVIMEGLQMSQARGYKTGGTVHLIINNQVGFTTSHPEDARSTEYCSDVAKMVEAPVFHVNGDDPEAVVFVSKLAMDYRTEFGKDVVIDLVCYRRHGHNEADEPAVTQPVMYDNIRSRETTRSVYAKQLIKKQIVEEDEASELLTAYRDGLDAGKNIIVNTLGMVGNKHTVDWQKYKGEDWREGIDTGLSLDKIRAYTNTLTTLPEGFGLHSRVSQIIKNRDKMAAGGTPMDWGFAENIAYAGLLEDGHQIRISGQDSGRGTFFHRHAELHNQETGDTYIPLKNITEPEDFYVINSLLSEEAVLGFEYGYSTAQPNTLVIWEAQFGDFANGAQVVIDQFISSGEAKWGRISSLALFLPHGYEGQGPEHSSARLERYLQLCAEGNIQVCVPSTPAQMFHMIRRQMLRSFRKPLIVMTPKSLLRHRLSTSSLEDIVSGRFQAVIDETDKLEPDNITRVVACCGKVYYDLLQTRRDEEIEHVALVRIEQLYPFPDEEVAKVMQRYPNAKEFVWCQEEPKNQGAWYQTRHRLISSLKMADIKGEFDYAGREASASTAAGYHALHAYEQKQLVSQALGLPEPS